MPSKRMNQKLSKILNQYTEPFDNLNQKSRVINNGRKVVDFLNKSGRQWNSEYDELSGNIKKSVNARLLGILKNLEIKK